MFELKILSREAIPRALEKAERYRLLSEPSEAESICLDVLHIEPDNQQALITLLLARTDQFESGLPVDRAREVLPRLHGNYERSYYEGIIWERRGKARLHHPAPGTSSGAFECLSEAMRRYEQAASIRPPENDDAMLRWNTCARLIMSNPKLKPAPEERHEEFLE